jgi:multicomponent Na+:H+ antiporter subunit E
VIYAVNLMIMLGWALATGDWSSASLLMGFVVGFLCLWVTRDLFRAERYHARLIGAAGLAAYFLYDLVKSSVRVAADVLSPALRARPAFVTMPLDAETDVEITLTANLITLTPGTLSVDVTPDRRGLIIHAMYAEDPDAVIEGCKTMERRVLEALR